MKALLEPDHTIFEEVERSETLRESKLELLSAASKLTKLIRADRSAMELSTSRSISVSLRLANVTQDINHLLQALINLLHCIDIDFDILVPELTKDRQL